MIPFVRTALLLVAIGVGAPAPLAAEAQQPAKIARIGRLSPVTPSDDARILAPFRQALRDLGWAEGQNIAIEYRFAEGKPDRLPALAAELVGLKVDLILAGSPAGALAAKRATGTIPIVIVTTGDPVASGLVASLARPGGNLTGVTVLTQELNSKRLQLLKEAFPRVIRVAVLSNPATPDIGPSVKGVEAAARALGVQLRVLEVRDPTGLENAFRTMTTDRSGALIVLTDPMFLTHRRRIMELAAKSRLPAMYPLREHVDDGGLMFYGATLPDMYRHAATFVDKILKGAKPADIPVEQPTRFELIINGKTAKAFGLTIPQALLLRADHVIQ